MMEQKYGDAREDGYIFDGWTIKKGKRYQVWRSPAAFAKRTVDRLLRLKRSTIAANDPGKLVSVRSNDAERNRVRRVEKGVLINGQRREAYETRGAITRANNLKWCKENWAKVLESRSRPQYAIAAKARSRVIRALKQQGLKKSLSTELLLGCSMAELMSHLESLFKPGMAWNNHGRDGWHIDHILPCASFNLLDPEEQRKCFHYTNLQPLWGKDNLSKGGRIAAEATQ